MTKEKGLEKLTQEWKKPGGWISPMMEPLSGKKITQGPDNGMHLTPTFPLLHPSISLSLFQEESLSRALQQKCIASKITVASSVIDTG